MASIGPVSVVDVVVLLLLLHGVAIVVAMVLKGDGQSKATSLARYNEMRVFATLFSLTAVAAWAVVAVGPVGWLEALAGTGVLWPLGIGVVVLSVAISNGRLLAGVLRARLRSGPPAPGDLVALSGTTRPVGGTVEAPFSGVEALCLQATTEAYESTAGVTVTGATGGTWADHDEQVTSRPFAVERGGDQVRVDPGAARWQLPRTYEATVPGDEQAPDAVARAVTASPDLDVPASPEVGLSVEKTRYGEWALQPGREVLVVGEASSDDQGTVVDGGTPFVVTQGAPGLVYGSMVAWTVGGGTVGGWLLLTGFRGLAAVAGLG